MFMTIITVKDIKTEQINVNNVFTKFKFRETIYIKLSSNIKIQKDSILRLI